MKKGFTLIELLAVLVVISIIALIAVPSVSNIIEKSRLKTIESSALGYVRAVKDKSSVGELNTSRDEIEEEAYTVSDLSNLGVAVKGIKPSDGAINLKNGNIDSATLCMDDYKIKYENGKVASVKKEKNCKIDYDYPSRAYTFYIGSCNISGEKYCYNKTKVPHKLSEKRNIYYYTDYSKLRSFDSPFYVDMEVNPVNGLIKSRKLCLYNDKFSDKDLCLTNNYEDNIKKLKSYLKVDESGKSEFEHVTCNVKNDGTFECVDKDPNYINKYNTRKDEGYTYTELIIDIHDSGSTFILRDNTKTDKYSGYKQNYLGISTFDQSSITPDGEFGN